MNNDLDLTNHLRRLASTLPSEARGSVEQNLLTAFRARHPRRTPLLYIAAAALVCIAALAGLMFHKPAAVAGRIYNAPGFVALPYSESGVPMESAVVIRVQMRSSELTSLGVPMPAVPPGDKFKADLLVGQDGVPRAVRLVR